MTSKKIPVPTADEGEKVIFLTIEEVRQYLSLGRSMTYKMVKSGEIPSVRFGDSIRVPKHLLDKYIAEKIGQIPAPYNGEDVVFLTIEEVFKRLYLGRSTAYGLVKTGEIPSLTFGKSIRVPEYLLNSYITENLSQVAAIQPGK
ncbi:MAG: helix-turn-helix domain-containing protein [Anaerolineae bacterium]|nr:helix-turn-helix domain-containing protein [Anaerolineae bacterium]